MAQVSKRVMSGKVQERIFKIFWQSLASCKDTESVSKFLEDLLTPTEKIMLAKRVSIALMLLKGYDYRSICNTLKVSSPTIWSVNLWLKTKGSGYKAVLEKIKVNEELSTFWENVQAIIEESFPPRYGTDWKEARRKQWEKRRKKEDGR